MCIRRGKKKKDEIHGSIFNVGEKEGVSSSSAQHRVVCPTANAVVAAAATVTTATSHFVRPQSREEWISRRGKKKTSARSYGETFPSRFFPLSPFSSSPPPPRVPK